MSDSIRLIEARLALEAASAAGLKVFRKGARIQVVGMAPPTGYDDPNAPIASQLADYVREIEHLLPNEGDSAAALQPLALSGLVLPDGLRAQLGHGGKP